MKLVKQIELEIEEFGEFRLITSPTNTFILHVKDMPKNLNDLWNFKDWEKQLIFISGEYLASYFEGNWDASIGKIDEREALRRGQTLYRSGFNEGLLYYIDGKPVVRKIQCEFWSTYYPDINGLKKVLEKHDQWHNIEIVRQTLSLNVDITGNEYLEAKYLPTQKEMTGWGKRKNITYLMQNIGNSYGLLHEAKYIKKFKNE